MGYRLRHDEPGVGMSIRLRLAAVFTAAAAILFALGSWLFVAELSSSLLGAIDAQLAGQLSPAARYLPGARARRARRPGPAPGEYVVQVIDPAGPGPRRQPRGGPDAAAEPRPRSARPAGHRLVVTQATEDERERVMAAPLTGHRAGSRWPAVSLEAYDGTLSDVVRNLLIAGAVFVAAAGLGAYGLARAALSPVERLRREVAAALRTRQARHPARRRSRATRDEIAALAATMNELLARLQPGAGPAAGPGGGRQPRAAHPVRGAARRAGAGRPPRPEPGGTRRRGGPGQRGGRPAGADHRAAAVPGPERRGPGQPRRRTGHAT